MQNPRLASRYAKSLLDLAIERNSLETTLKDMRTLHDICASSRDFELMLRSPVIKSDKKLAIINAVLKGQSISELTNAFIGLLISKGRELNLPEIVSAFITQYNELKDIMTVKLVTAVPVNDNLKKNIEQKLVGFMEGGTIQMETSVDESLIGGFVLEIEDRLYDASVKKKLSDIRSTLIDTSYVNKMN